MLYNVPQGKSLRDVILLAQFPLELSGNEDILLIQMVEFSYRRSIMTEQPVARFDLQITMPDSSAEAIDAAARQLLSELREQDVESAELARGGSAPDGTKSADPVTLGSLAIAVLPALLPKLLEFIKDWTGRGQGRAVKFKGKIAGQTIQFEGSAEDLQKLITTLSKN
jgi:hypothetical protein